MATTKKSDSLASKALDLSEFERLYYIYGSYAFGLASLQVGLEPAEDIVHEAYLRFWHEPGLHSLHGAAFLKWLVGEVQQLCQGRLLATETAGSRPGHPQP